MRSVLRTIAQCHSHHILHRDVKPGNFLLLNSSPHSPLKAIGALPVLKPVGCSPLKASAVAKSTMNSLHIPMVCIMSLPST